MKLLENMDALIFDLDGTLVDSMWVWVAIDKEYLKKYNLKEPDDFYENMEGKSYSEVARYYQEIFPELPCTLDEIMDEWTEMAHEKYMTQVPLKQGAKQFLKEVKRLGIRTGIATSNSKEMVTDTLKALGVDDLFDSVRSACEVQAGKPSPDVYLLVSEDLKVNPEKCLVFEDVPMGILAGKNAGMKVCAVEDEFSKIQEDKKRELADYYIKDYYDIMNQTYEVL
ncbi:MAG: HAD family hydrolase [Lachnospiraceae bacterium]